MLGELRQPYVTDNGYAEIVAQLPLAVRGNRMRARARPGAGGLMRAADFTCRDCNIVEAPKPCPCFTNPGPNARIVCTDCGGIDTHREVAPGIWICPGCVDMHRRAA